MAVRSADRPIDKVREEVIDQLIVNYGHEQLSAEAFERRLDEALASSDIAELNELVRDLDLQSDKTYADRKREELAPRLDRPVGSSGDVEYSINVFGGNNRAGTWHVPKEIRMINVFGGAELDFTDAVFSHPTLRIKVLTLFGGASIYVREDVNTISKIVCVFGGSDCQAPASGSSDAPVVIVEGLVMFGGVSIEVKRTLREKFIEFANRIRGLRSAGRSTENRPSDATPLFKSSGPR
ncbi:MAG: DUF1707 and DUF2154 domain-containing protein [Pseudomonadota bacterium]